MPSIVTRTVYGSALQTCLLTKLPFTLLPNTTLNEKLEIEQGVPPGAGVIPTVAYYAIGNGGHNFQLGTNNIPLVQSYKHDPRDAALFQQIPFVCRPVGSDLTTQQQANYALRKLITVNSQSYVAYYLRRLDLSATTVALALQNVANGVITSTSFVPGPSNLSPTPSVLSNSGSNDVASTFLNVSAPVPINLSQQDCTELMNACTILFGDAGYAIISEIGLCSGVDKSISVGGGATFNEAVAVQIVAHVAAFHSIPQTPTGLSGELDLGSNDPAVTQS